MANRARKKRKPKTVKQLLNGNYRLRAAGLITHFPQDVTDYVSFSLLVDVNGKWRLETEFSQRVLLHLQMSQMTPVVTLRFLQDKLDRYEKMAQENVDK